MMTLVEGKIYKALPVHKDAYGFWMAELTLPTPLPRDDVLTRIDEFVQSTHDPYKPLSGCLLGDEDVEFVSKVVLARDPSKTFGTPPIYLCNAIERELRIRTNWQCYKPETLSGFHCILGRVPGYEGNPVSMEHVIELLPQNSNLTLQQSHLFSARFGRKGYNEAAVNVTGPLKALNELSILAAKIRQLRYVAATRRHVRVFEQ